MSECCDSGQIAVPEIQDALRVNGKSSRDKRTLGARIFEARLKMVEYEKFADIVRVQGGNALAATISSEESNFSNVS